MFKAQKHSKDIVKMVIVTSVVQSLCTVVLSWTDTEEKKVFIFVFFVH